MRMEEVMTDERKAFEEWALAPPYERHSSLMRRYESDETKCAWPGQYRNIETQFAFEAFCEGAAWQARAAVARDVWPVLPKHRLEDAAAPASGETAQPVMIPYATHLEVVAEHLRQTAPGAAEEDATAPPRKLKSMPEDGFNEVLGVLRDMGRAMDDSPRPAPAPVEVDGEPKATAAAEMAAFREWAWNNTETPDAIGNMHGRDAAMYAWMARAKISRHAAAAEITALREALAWVMRNCVKDGAIIPSEHRDAINEALRATEKP
jgi:hypothetical protein